MKHHIKIREEDIYKSKNPYKEITFVDNLIFWIEKIEIKNETSNAIFTRPFNLKESIPQNLTEGNFLIKSSFHGYGGKSYQCIHIDSKIWIIWIDQKSKSLWLQIFIINKSKDKNNNYLIKSGKPKKLTKSYRGNFDSSFVIVNQNLLMGLFERENNDYLFLIDVDKEEQKLRIQKKFKNFAGSLSANLNNKFISWIEWDEYMPWENNDLFIAEINLQGNLMKIIKFVDSKINAFKLVSFFQPYWIHENTLVCAEDSSGWWNLLFLEIKTIDKINIKQRIIKPFYEYGNPQWVSGISLFSGLEDDFYCLAKHKESWVLEHYQKCLYVEQIPLSFNCLKDLHVNSNKIICKASNNFTFETLIEIDNNKLGGSPMSLKFLGQVDSYVYSESESFWYRGFNNEITHSWIYKPEEINKEKPPLIIRAHSGPTSCFDGALNSEVQFFLSKGWFVAEANYGGSSGFGRMYRERLNKEWGVVDVFDCIALAKALIAQERIDHSRIVVLGNSAGGLTALTGLYSTKIFSGAICKYPVLDLTEMNNHTHRFEKNYLNSLLGKISDDREKYFKRSPINNVNKINKSTLLFHGKKDQVINYQKTLDFNKELLNRGVYSEIHLLEDEGHGFSKEENKLFTLKTIEKFLKNHLNF